MRVKAPRRACNYRGACGKVSESIYPRAACHFASFDFLVVETLLSSAPVSHSDLPHSQLYSICLFSAILTLIYRIVTFLLLVIPHKMVRAV